MEKYAPVVNPEVSLGVDLGRTKEASFPGMLRMERTVLCLCPV